MLVLIGHRTKPKKELWLGQYQCPVCHSVQHHHLFKFQEYHTIFFVPIIVTTLKQGYICDHCQTFHAWKKDEYKATYAERLNKFKAREFPPEIVLQDFSPKAVKLVPKWIACLLWGLLTLLMTYGMIEMIREIHTFEPSSLPFILMMAAMFYVPLFFLIKSLVFACRKAAWYRQVSSEQGYSS